MNRNESADFTGHWQQTFGRWNPRRIAMTQVWHFS
jgi:hypothetical protein